MFYYQGLKTHTVILMKSFGLYIFWIVSHYISSHLYVTFCVPATFYGFIQSIFLTPAPHCYALRWVIYNGGNNICVMWLLCGAWCVCCFQTIAVNTFTPVSSFVMEPKPKNLNVV